ncbi:MAG: TonB family protein [Saprospiraceae bacterium]
MSRCLIQSMMMKKIIFLFFLLPVLSATAQKRVYYNDRQEVVKDTSDYVHYEIATKQSRKRIYVQRYNSDHILTHEGLFSDYDPPKRTPEGLHKRYRQTGELWYTEEFENGNRNGELHSYYPSGALKRVEKYANGQRTEGACFSEDGAPVEYTPMERQPEYPGGEAALLQYLMEEVQYPKSALENGITGVAVVRFVVNKEGVVQDVQLLKDPGGGCGQEAVRAVQAMSSWIPGFHDDQPGKVRYSLPVKFNLESGRRSSRN